MSPIWHASLKVEFDAREVVDRVPKKKGNSTIVLVPSEWIGKRVKVVLLEEPNP